MISILKVEKYRALLSVAFEEPQWIETRVNQFEDIYVKWGNLKVYVESIQPHTAITHD